MLNLNDPRDLRAFEEAEKHAKNMEGTNFCLVMRNPDGDLSVYPRENQPCQSGEMRKYGLSSTRPNDPRPGDLRDPFPEGVVEAVSVCWKSRRSYFDFIEMVVSHVSPYRKAASVSTTHPVSNRYDGSVRGCVFTDTDVDPTLFVNMLQFINSTSLLTWELMMEYLPEEYVIPAMMLTSPSANPKVCQPQPFLYYFPANAAIHRVMSGEFTDLSGGTWRAGFDYNRPNLQDLYKAVDGEVSTNVMQEISIRGLYKTVPNPRYPGYNMQTVDLSEYFAAVKEIIDTACQKHEESKTEKEKIVEEVSDRD